VLIRALVALILRYLWVGLADGPQREIRLRQLRRRWAKDHAVFGEALEDLSYFDPGTSDAVREEANALEKDGVPGMPTDEAIAKQLDEDLRPEAPRFFELVYALIYRSTSEVAHYGLGALTRGLGARPTSSGTDYALNQRDERRAAESLFLGLIAFGSFADFADGVISHGLTKEIGAIVRSLSARSS
jgi:hypothetical protein